jgi:hypothetical protein
MDIRENGRKKKGMLLFFFSVSPFPLSTQIGHATPGILSAAYV